MLLKNDSQIIRVLDVREDRRLIISCTQKSMPMWISKCDLDGYFPCNEAALSFSIADFDALSPEQRHYAHERYTLIAGVLPFLGDKQRRSEMIARIASMQNVSKQTIRHYLYRYLVYQNIAALAPPTKEKNTSLTADEKNIRWALNRFYYTRHKNILASAYAQMLRYRYCDDSGALLPDHPSIYQFRYFYKKHRSMQNYYISRDGMKHYQRNNRPLYPPLR